LTRIISWNVNGLRSAHRKGFLAWLGAARADLVALQEVRAREEQLPAEVRAPSGWSAHIVSGTRPGYSGVAIYSRRPPDAVSTSLGAARFDDEARLVLARFGKLHLASAYFPKGGNREGDLRRMPYKLAFTRQLLRTLEPLLARERVLVMGDFNVAHEAIDLARPRQNVKNSGFLPSERRAFARWLEAGFVDTFRHFEKGAGHYTWWNNFGGCRERNIGWRIDYVLASPAVMPFLQGAAIHPEVRGSDHVPISVDVDPAIF
jgi:exodeoxyribonuclease-3